MYILLYDGLCGFCNSTVLLILNHDSNNSMRFAALQSDFAQSVLNRYPHLRRVDSLILIESIDTPDEKIHIRSSGALMVASYLGGFWNIFRIAWIIPRPVRDWIYDRFAQHRYRLFGTYDTCPIPPPEVRSRFIQ